MSTKWEKLQLDAVLTLQRGHDLPSHQRQPGIIPIVSSSGITDYHSEAKAQPPGVVTGRYGTIGEVFYIDEPYWPLNTALYVKDFKGNNPKFTAYLLETLNLKEMNSAGAVPGINRNHLHKLQVLFPKKKIIQDRIVALISAYEDLIKNNLVCIKLLEKMAQITYEEWFVRMQFPGHETAEINSDTGLPEGWETGSCFDSMEVLSGGTPKTNIEDYWNGSIKFFTPKDASDGAYTNITEKTITSLGMKKCNSQLYEKDTLFITARGTVGKLNLAHEPMAMNQSCYALIARVGLTQYFLYCALTKIIDAFKGAASGGVFDTIVIDTFKFLPFVKPKVEVVTKFDDLVTPLFSRMSNLLEQNRLLEEAKNILLPRLMSGIIDIEKVELPEALLARVQANDTPEEQAFTG